MDNGSSAGTAMGAGLGGIMIGVLIGAVIGGVVALLFAPQTGNETREMVKNRFGRMKEVFSQSADDINRMAEKTSNQVKSSAREMRQST
jgi:gas vesicle protein